MARYTNRFQSSRSDEQIKQIAESFFTTEGFKLTDYQGEQLYKKGVGLMTAPQFIKLSSLNGAVQIEAFLKFAWLPGVYSGEMGLDGIFGALPKRLLKKTVTNLEDLLK